MPEMMQRPVLNNDVMNPRLAREQAKTGEITASLVWNGGSDLDLHADVLLKNGTLDKISYSSKKGVGGALDVDANSNNSSLIQDPVENIYWDKPPAGTFKVWVHNYCQRGKDRDVPYRVALKLPDQELDFEGSLANHQRKTCFCFKVDDSGDVEIQDVEMLPAEVQDTPVRASNASRARRTPRCPAGVVPVATVPARPSGIAKGKKGKSLVMAGKALKTSGGLKKDHLTISKKGKVVSKKASDRSKSCYEVTLQPWVDACRAAKAALGLSGFVAMRRNTDAYKKARDLYDARAHNEVRV